MFQNYSETYSAAIVSLAGVLVLFARMFDLPIVESDIVFILGALANLGGILWVMAHRLNKEDITIIGARK